MRNVQDLKRILNNPDVVQSPELNSIRQFQYIKPTPSPNDMNSMCSFSPRNFTKDSEKKESRARISSGHGNITNFVVGGHTNQRYSENATMNTFRTQNLPPSSRKKKISLKNRSNRIQDRSKELNSIDETTPKSVMKTSPLGRSDVIRNHQAMVDQIPKFESGSRNNLDLSPMTSPPRLMNIEDVSKLKMTSFGQKRRNQHSGSLEPHKMSYQEKKTQNDAQRMSNLQRQGPRGAMPNPMIETISRSISKENSSALIMKKYTPQYAPKKDIVKYPTSRQNFGQYFSQKKKQKQDQPTTGYNSTLKKVTKRVDSVEELLKRRRISDQSSIFSVTHKPMPINPSNTPSLPRDFKNVPNNLPDYSLESSALVTSTIISPQKSVNNRISEDGFSGATSLTESQFPFQIQPKQQKYNIYENYSIGTIDQLSRRFDPQSYRNSTCFSTYSRGGKFDTRRESKIITNNTSQILDTQKSGISEGTTPIYNQSRDQIINTNFTSAVKDKLVKSKEKRNSSGDNKKNNQSNYNSSISIAEREVIKNQFSNDPLNKRMKLDKYGKNHRYEPRYIKNKNGSDNPRNNRQRNSKIPEEETPRFQGSDKDIKNKFSRKKSSEEEIKESSPEQKANIGQRGESSPGSQSNKDQKIHGILKPRLSKFSQSRSNSVQFKPSSGTRESVSFNKLLDKIDSPKEPHTISEVSELSRSIPAKSKTTEERGSKTISDLPRTSVANNMKFPSIQEARLSNLGRNEQQNGLKNANFSQTFEVIDEDTIPSNEASPGRNRYEYGPHAGRKVEKKPIQRQSQPTAKPSYKRMTTIEENMKSGKKLFSGLNKANKFNKGSSKDVPSPRMNSKITESIGESYSDRTESQEVVEKNEVSKYQSIDFNIQKSAILNANKTSKTDNNSEVTSLRNKSSKANKNNQKNKNPLETENLSSPKMSTQYNYSYTQNTPSHNNRDSYGKRSANGTKISDLSQRNLQNDRGNGSSTHISNNQQLNSNKNAKSSILNYSSPKNKESAKSIENIRQTLKNYDNHVNTENDERPTADGIREIKRSSTRDKHRSSDKTFKTHDSSNSQRQSHNVKYDSIALGNVNVYNTDNVPTQRQKYSSKKSSSPENNSRRYSSSYRSRTVKNSKYSNGGNLKSSRISGFRDSINLLSGYKTDPFGDEMDSPVKNTLTREPEHYFEAFDSVQITKDLLYVGPVDRTTGKFNGYGRVMTSKGELIYEGNILNTR